MHTPEVLRQMTRIPDQRQESDGPAAAEAGVLRQACVDQRVRAEGFCSQSGSRYSGLEIAAQAGQRMRL